MADDAKAKLPVFIDKFGLLKPFDGKACKFMPDLVWKSMERAFRGSRMFEVVKSQPKERGFDISGTIQNVEYDEKKSLVKAKLSVVLAETPGRSFFGNVSGGASVDGVKAAKLEKALEELIEALADSHAGHAVMQCEKKANAR